MVKTLPANAQDLRDSGSMPRSRRSLQEGMANHFSILAWKIPWLEEPGRLQSMGSHRVGHDWSLSTYTHNYIRRHNYGTRGSHLWNHHGYNCD